MNVQAYDRASNALDVSRVVPVYREERNIHSFLERTERVLSGRDGKYEIIFALDLSPDRSEEIILAIDTPGCEALGLAVARIIGRWIGQRRGTISLRDRLHRKPKWISP